MADVHVGSVYRAQVQEVVQEKKARWRRELQNYPGCLWPQHGHWFGKGKRFLVHDSPLCVCPSGYFVQALQRFDTVRPAAHPRSVVPQMLWGPGMCVDLEQHSCSVVVLCGAVQTGDERTVRRPSAGAVRSGPDSFLRQRAVCIRGPGLGVRETLRSDLYSFSLNTKWEQLIYLYVFFYLKVTAIY